MFLVIIKTVTKNGQSDIESVMIIKTVTKSGQSDIESVISKSRWIEFCWDECVKSDRLRVNSSQIINKRTIHP